MTVLRPDIVAMTGYTPGEQFDSALKLNTNECAYPPSPAVRQVLTDIADDRLRLYPDPACQALREAVARNLGLAAERVLVGNGSDDCLTILYRASCRPGDRVAAPWPSYGLYETNARIQGVPFVRVPFNDLGADGWRLPIDGLAASGARLVLVANPNNPSSSLVPIADLAELARRCPGLVVVDEAYIDYAGAEASALPLLADHDNLVVLRTMSKSYAMAGARIGFLISEPGLVAHLHKVKDSYNVNALSQAIGLAALEDRSHHQRLVATTLANRRDLERRCAGCGWWWPPAAGNFLLCTVGVGAGTIMRGLRERGILVRWWDDDLLRERLRITVGTPDQHQLLFDAIDELHNR